MLLSTLLLLDMAGSYEDEYEVWYRENWQISSVGSTVEQNKVLFNVVIKPCRLYSACRTF